jgi:protein ImuA
MTNDGFNKNIPLRTARAHEVTGASAVTFAAIACGLGRGPAIWLTGSRQNESLNPDGLAEFCAPGQLLFAKGKNHIDLLAASEEALRSGAISTVVAELEKPLDLTAGRRLQLAAEAGKTTGIFIIGEEMGSNAAETRWHCAPLFAPPDSTLQRWKLIKNKSGTIGMWDVRWDAQARRIIVVSKAGQRPDSPGQAG